MTSFDERLTEMGIIIPDMQPPLANYVPANRSGNLVFTAGKFEALFIFRDENTANFLETKIPDFYESGIITILFYKPKSILMLNFFAK